MKFRYLAIAAMALFLPFLATGCGDDSTGDLSESEISDQLQEGGLDEKTSDCMAGVIKDADLTEDELNEYIKDPTGDGKAAKAITPAITDCMMVDTGS